MLKLILKTLLYPTFLTAFLGLSALSSHGSTLIPIKFNYPTSTNWIRIQNEGKRSDRQIIFAQIEEILPVVERPQLSKPPILKPRPPVGPPKPVPVRIWQVRLITIHESQRQPGYVESYAEVNCQQSQMRVIQKIAVSYSDIQSPEAEILEAQKKSQTLQQQPPRSRGAVLQSTKGEPWQPIATTHPIFKFVCNQSSWSSALKNSEGKPPVGTPTTISEDVLAKQGFAFVGALGVAPQELFAYAWNQVWTDGDRPASFSQPSRPNPTPVLKPTLPEYVTTLAYTTSISGRAVGATAAKPAAYAAFEEALQAGAAIRPEIDWLIREGTPAGRIYGAVLLMHLDLKAGRQALEQMRSDQTPLWELNGGITEKSVSTIVTEILKGQSVFPTPEPIAPTRK